MLFSRKYRHYLAIVLPLIFAVAIVGTMPAIAHAQSDADKAVYEGAKREARAERWFEAINLLNSVASAYKNDATFFEFQGNTYREWALTEIKGASRTERFQLAVKAFERSLELRPRDPQTLHLLAASLSNLGRYEEAEKQERLVVTLRPNDKYAHKGLGLICLELKKWTEAEGAYRAAVKLDPKDAEFHNGLGLSLFRQDKWALAEPEFRQAVALNNTVIAHVLNVGAALLKQGKREEAKPFVQEARRMGLKEHWAIVELGLANTPLPTVALFQSNDPETLRKQARVAQDAKKWDEVERLYTQLILLSPNNPNDYGYRGQARYENKKYAESFADSTRAETLYRLQNGTPSQLAPVITNRALASLGLNEPYRALADATSAIEIDPKNTAAWLVLADAKYAIGDYDGAIAGFNRAKQLNTAFTRNFTREGADQNAIGKALVDNKADTKADSDAGDLAFNAKKYGEAEKSYTKVLEKKPLNAGTWAYRGDTFFDNGLYEKGFMDYCVAATLYQSLKFNGDIKANLKSAVLNRANLTRVRGGVDNLVAAINDCELGLKIVPEDEGLKKLLTQSQTQLVTEQKLAEPISLVELEKLFQEAIEADKKGKFGAFGEIKKRLDNFLTKEPNNAKALVLRGKAEGTESFSSARRLPFYEKAILADPSNAEAYFLRGTEKKSQMLFTASSFNGTAPVGEELETYKKIVSDFKKAISLGYKKLEAVAELAQTFSTMQDYKEAASTISLAIVQEPSNISHYRDRASYYYKQSLWEKTIADQTKVIALETKPSASLYVYRGDTYTSAKNFRAAFADFEKARELDPKDPDIYLGFAWAKLQSGDKPGATADYAKAREMDSDIPIIKPDLSNAESLNKDRSRLRLRRVMKKLDDNKIDTKALLKASEELAAKKKELDAALDIKLARKMVEEAEKEGYKVKKAVELLDIYVKAQPKNAEILVLRGRAGEAEGADDVYEYYSRAIAADPKNAEAYARRGVIIQKTSLTDIDYSDGDELPDLRKAVSLGWDGADALYALARAVETPTEAVSILDKLIKRFPGNADYVKTRAEKLREIKN
jgi:tetratricopeptide (TPR) repeat protein